jgi:CheY-like chemotaxis protein
MAIPRRGRAEEEQGADFEKSKIKIIALTASAFEEGRKKVLAAGCDDFIGKPVHYNV